MALWHPSSRQRFRTEHIKSRTQSTSDHSNSFQPRYTVFTAHDETWARFCAHLKHIQEKLWVKNLDKSWFYLSNKYSEFIHPRYSYMYCIYFSMTKWSLFCLPFQFNLNESGQKISSFTCKMLIQKKHNRVIKVGLSTLAIFSKPVEAKW